MSHNPKTEIHKNTAQCTRRRVIKFIIKNVPVVIFLMMSFFHDYQSECDGGLALKPEVVQSTSLSVQHPASSVLVLEEKEARWDNGTLNYWAAEYQKTEGQGFTIKVDKCPQVIAGFQIKNTARGSISSRGTKRFRISGALDENSPWKTLVEDQLVDTEGKSAVLRNFTFEEPFEVQYLKFDLLSYWGTNGGGLQFFAAIPTTRKSLKKC